MDDNASAKRERLHEVFEALMRAATGGFRERESAALELANELVRRWCEVELRRMAMRYDDHVVVSGERYRRHDAGTRRYHTLCGPIDVRRATYRRVGVHNGPTVVPLELEAGIVENATPALAFSVTQGFAERPLRHYEDEMRAAHREVPSRSTLERIGKRIGETIHDALPIIEPFVRATEDVPAEARSISVGIDRTTVPMAEPATEPRARRREPYVRRPPPPVTVAYRMSYVATVAVHDRNGTALKTARFAATAEEGPEALMRQVAAEVKHFLARRPELPLTIVQDGAPELWNLVDAWLERDSIIAAAKHIDRFHVDERLAEIADAIAASDRIAHALYAQWRAQLDRSDGAIDRICRSLHRLWHHLAFDAIEDKPRPRYWVRRARTQLIGERAQIAWGHLAYLDERRSYLRYAASRNRGLPIGSGVTEGACKSVIATRFKRSGQRWFENGLSPCLQLRALHLSARLRPCFDRIVAERRASLGTA
jgi:hypothetical protein